MYTVIISANSPLAYKEAIKVMPDVEFLGMLDEGESVSCEVHYTTPRREFTIEYTKQDGEVYVDVEES